MVHEERLEIGEKCFVSAVMLVLAIEAGLTVVTNGMHFSWAGLLLGIIGFCLVLFLANRLYAGSREARTIALGWVSFELVYAVCALVLLLSSVHGAETARRIGAPAVWPVFLKGAVYAYLGWVLLRMPSVRDFFAEKRGDMGHRKVLAQPVPVQEPDQGPALAFTAQQNEAARGLAQYIRLVVGGLIALGVLQLFFGAVVYGLRSVTSPGIFVVVQGVLTLILGVALGAPANAIRPVVTPEAQAKGQLMALLTSLLKFFKLQVIVGLLLAAVIVARYVIAR